MSLPNLAGLPQTRAEPVCRRELRVAGILEVPLEYKDEVFQLMEVKSRVGGSVDGIQLRRAWRYWVAQGPVPVDIARRLYADPAGVRDVRVNGDGNGEAPEGWHVSWYDAAKRRMWPLKEKAYAEQLIKHPDSSMKDSAQRLLDTCVFTDTPEEDGGEGFVELYHIDSEVGLRVFADYVGGRSRRERQLERALLVIEGVCLAVDPEKKDFWPIYEIAHVVGGHCSNPHEDWRKQIDEVAAQLKKDKIVDVDKVMRKCRHV